MPEVPFVAARWFTPVAHRAIDLLVIHSMEMPEKPDTAEGCAAYFAAGSKEASAHACVDDNSRVDCVADHDVAWAAPGANHNGLHLEQAGYARQSRDEWLDAYGSAMISGPAAAWVAEKAAAYAVPLVALDAAALLRPDPRGITTHAAVSNAWHRTDHTDPGEGYPLDVLLESARRLGAPADEEDMTDAERQMLAELHAEVVGRDDDGNLWRIARNMHHQIVVPGVGLQALVAAASNATVAVDPRAIAAAVVEALPRADAQAVVDAIAERLAR